MVSQFATINLKVDFEPIRRAGFTLRRVAIREMYKDVPIFQELALEVCIHGRIATKMCWECCETCNHDEHRCHFCGDGLRHNGTDWKTGLEHPCYTDAREEYEQQLRWELDRLGSSNA